jgi:hypothetical protein
MWCKILAMSDEAPTSTPATPHLHGKLLLDVIAALQELFHKTPKVDQAHVQRLADHAETLKAEQK